MHLVNPRDLYRWCSIPAQKLQDHPDLRVSLRIVRDSNEMGNLMARELCDLIATTRPGALPGPSCLAGPSARHALFTALVNSGRTRLDLTVFHMDECLDWQGRLLPRNHPYNFRTFMEEYFYGGVLPELAVPEKQRYWLTPVTAGLVGSAIDEATVDLTIGGWDRDGTSPTTRRAATRTITLPSMNSPHPPSVSRKTISIRFSRSPNALSAGAISSFHRCRSRSVSENASPRAKSGFTAIPAPGKTPHSGWRFSASRRRSTR